jgi:hypothetical protein
MTGNSTARIGVQTGRREHSFEANQERPRTANEPPPADLNARRLAIGDAQP